MANTYRKPVQRRTISTFTDDEILDVNKDNRAYQTKIVDEDIKLPIINFKVVDISVKYFINSIVNSTVKQNNEVKKIPVYHSSPETWAIAQSKGHLRDEKNKLMLPLLIYKKSSVESIDNLSRQKLREHDTDLGWKFGTRYSNATPYDKFSKLINQHPVKESYSITAPDYVRISYDIIVWTETLTQLNGVVESFIYHEGRSGGYPYKFTMKVDSFDFDSENQVGEDKLSKCNISMHVNAAMIPENAGDKTNAQKTYSLRSLVFKESILE